MLKTAISTFNVLQKRLSEYWNTFKGPVIGPHHTEVHLEQTYHFLPCDLFRMKAKRGLNDSTCDLTMSDARLTSFTTNWDISPDILQNIKVCLHLNAVIYLDLKVTALRMDEWQIKQNLSLKVSYR